MKTRDIAIGYEFGRIFAEALGLPTDCLRGFTLRCYAGERVVVKAEFSIPTASAAPLATKEGREQFLSQITQYVLVDDPQVGGNR